MEKNRKLKSIKKSTKDNKSVKIESDKVKKPFDKKLYRLKKYSNKFKVQQWEENRKKTVLRDYYSQIEGEEKKFDVKKIYDDPRYRDSDEETPTPAPTTSIDRPEGEADLPKRKKVGRRAQEEFERLKNEKQNRREELSKRKLEKEEALKRYRKEKAEKYKRLSRKTKKGQPIMKERLEMLLDKIQKSIT